MVLLSIVSTSARSQLFLDQSQPKYNGGLSARSDFPKVQLVGQSFRAGITGILGEIEVGFFNKIDGLVTFQVYEGEGNLGRLLHSQMYRVVCNVDTLFPFSTYVPVTAGKLYTFLFMPGEGMPHPYGVQIGSDDPYPEGFEIFADTAKYSLDTHGFDLVFNTYVGDGIMMMKLLAVEAPHLRALACDTVESTIILSRLNAGLTIIDSIVTVPPFFFSGSFPYLLNGKTARSLPIQFIPSGSGEFSTPLKIYYNITDSLYFDTTFTLTATAYNLPNFTTSFASALVAGPKHDSLDILLRLSGDLDSSASILLGSQLLSCTLYFGDISLTSLTMESLLPGIALSQPIVAGNTLSFTSTLPFTFSGTRDFVRLRGYVSDDPVQRVIELHSSYTASRSDCHFPARSDQAVITTSPCVIEQITPNPTIDHSFTLHFCEEFPDARVRVFNMSGLKITEVTPQLTNKSCLITLPTPSSGNYVVEVTTSLGTTYTTVCVLN